MELGGSSSSEVPLGVAAKPRRVGTSDSSQTLAKPRYGDFAAAGVLLKPEPPINFLTYMTFLAEHKHEVPVVSSVSELVNRESDRIGSGATFSVYKGPWGKGKAAFKYLIDGTFPQIADRQGTAVAADDWREIRWKRQYDSAMKSVMFEIMILAKRPLSHHRNIIRLLAISWDEDKEIEQPTLTDLIRPVLVVELAWEEYPDLASYANHNSGRSRRLTIDEALSIAGDVADGLAALHSFGVVHGDLKPANVLLFLDTESATEIDPENRSRRLVAKVGDFGYSGIASSEDDVRGGTPFWNAPECLDSCSNKELKAFAMYQSRDIYSFGLVLVYLWTNGGSPFDGIGPSLAAIDWAKLDDQISDHCCALIRNSGFSKIAGKAAAAVEHVVRDTLYLDPRVRCPNIGGVRSMLIGEEKTGLVQEVEGYTRSSFFSIRVLGAPEPMSYESIDLSGFWRGSEKQIPESRKELLRRGVELDYINTLTKSERRSLFAAGHTFVNAEREANGQAPYYPRSSIHPDYLQKYPAEERLRLGEEIAEAIVSTDNDMLVGLGTIEESMLIKGLSYSYQPQGIFGITVSLRSCIEFNQLSIAERLIKLGQVSVTEGVGFSFSLLHLAAMFNRPGFVHLMAKHGLDVNQRGGDMGTTPLHEAVRTGNFEATVALLDCGANLEAKIHNTSFSRAYTPLEFAILSPAIAPRILSLLLERGAKYGHTPQSIGAIEASAARPTLLRVLLDHDDRLVQLETRQRTIIHVAVTANQPESVKMLLERGADANARDYRGRTPLAMLSSVNKFGTFFSNGIYGDMMGNARQLRPQMFNPEHWDEIRRLLLDYGGEEPEDYLELVGERKMMEAVASYLYWVNHVGTSFLGNHEVWKFIQDMASGTTPMEPTVMYGFAIKHIDEHKRIIVSYLSSMHTLAEATGHLPDGSAVLNVPFSADFKQYLTAWRKPVNWNEFIDFVIGVLRYMQDPTEPESPFPEGVNDADLDSVMDVTGNPLHATEPLGPIRRRILEYALNIPIPADYDAAMECMLSPFVPELPPGSIVLDEAREAFDKIRGFHKSVTEDFSAQNLAAFHDHLAQSVQPARVLSAADGAERLPASISADSNTDTSSYTPGFLSDLQPPSPIYICSINTEPPALRKIGFAVPVFLVLFMILILLWRMLTWLHWLTTSRFISLLLLYSLQQMILAFPTMLNDLSSLAVLALMGSWLASDNIWQFVLEYSFAKASFEFHFYKDPHRALIRQIAFRWRYGFPEVEPLILSHVRGNEWRYDFAELLEGLQGSHSLLLTWKGWIERPDAMSAVLDEWQREAAEGLASTEKCWGNGWWYYEGADDGRDAADAVAARCEDDEPRRERSGAWRKYKSVEVSKPERHLRKFGKIERMFHAKGRPELFQRFRVLFPPNVTGETYRALAKAFAEYPDILEATQRMFFE